MSGDSLDYYLQEIEDHAKQYDHCMSLSVIEGGSVELLLDTGINYYAEWIRGEGGDVCLFRCRETKRAVGCHLPMLNNKLAISHNGPIRINSGFKKDETP